MAKGKSKKLNEQKKLVEEDIIEYLDERHIEKVIEQLQRIRQKYPGIEIFLNSYDEIAVTGIFIESDEDFQKRLNQELMDEMNATKKKKILLEEKLKELELSIEKTKKAIKKIDD